MCMHVSVSDNHFKSNFCLFGWILIIILHFIELPKITWFQAALYFQKDQTIYVYLKLGLLLVWHGSVHV